MSDELPTPERILRYLRHEAERPLKAKELARALDVDTNLYRAFRDAFTGSGRGATPLPPISICSAAPCR